MVPAIATSGTMQLYAADTGDCAPSTGPSTGTVLAAFHAHSPAVPATAPMIPTAAVTLPSVPRLRSDQYMPITTQKAAKGIATIASTSPASGSTTGTGNVAGVPPKPTVVADV